MIEKKLEYDFLELQREVETNVLFPHKYDFGTVCTCEDCFQKVKMLKKFEEELQAKRELVRDCIDLHQDNFERCLHLASASQWAISMLCLLRNNHKIVSKKGGLSSTLEKDKLEEQMEHLNDLTANLLFDHLISKPVVISERCNDKEETDILPLAKEIRDGFYRYGITKFKEVTSPILKELEQIEKEHMQEKKSAEAQKKQLDPIISKKQIEKQIMVVKMLPLNELYLECQKLVDAISPFDERNTWLSKAYKDIMSTLSDMIRVRFEFWLRYQSASLTKKDHIMSGLKDTLESLCKKAALFNGRWEEDYAPYFTAYERKDAHPKRPRIQ
ncbi:unnamed protein product [Cuscuta epithymum]|uniref:Uncharacterized protein n=1 Tax=Cuscuta epithymum TaxID=186058 RepID=A0AAV0CXH8_9ASTE|nr:unnamed protein product [Cuscuta epithymum]